MRVAFLLLLPAFVAESYFVAATQAATLTSCTLVLDGSTTPPGDRIDVEAVLQAEEAEAALEVRAYLRSPTGAVEPVRSADPALQADDGSLLIRVELRAADRVARHAIAVPYAALNVPPGKHQLAYELRLVIDGRTAWTQPLPLTVVQTHAGERKKLEPRSLGAAPQAIDHTVAATVVDGAAQRTVNLRLLTAPVASTASSVAEIPRGFERLPIAGNSGLGTGGPDFANVPSQSADKLLPPERRTVWFATNRTAAESQGDGLKTQFTTTRATLSYGRCVVNFPVRHHRRGMLELPGWWKSDPEKHFLLLTTELLDDAAFRRSIGPRDVMLFVHGFANTFDDAVLRTAQVTYDVDFPGLPMTFSWPSRGAVSVENYHADEKEAEASAHDLAEVLRALTADDSPVGKVHVVAHSMGNRVTLQAFFQLFEQGHWTVAKKRLGQVVLAAPDVGAAKFNNLIGYAIEAAERVTYYYCQSDTALQMSQQANFYEPVGKYPYFQKGLDTINADGAGTGFLGHDYYSSSLKVLADLELLLRYGSDPAERIPPLGALTSVYGHQHYSFLPMTATIVGGE